MSKEFDSWFNEADRGIWPGKVEYEAMQKAFKAGRTLGRRETKEEAARIAKDQDFPSHGDCDSCRTARVIANFIEAIPTEVEK